MTEWRAQSIPQADRLLVIFSDIEMGAGGPADDFPHSEHLAELLLSYNEPPYDGVAVDLIFNGDTFDLMKTSHLGEYPRHITRDVALAKLMRIAAAHPLFFQGLRRFLTQSKTERNAYFVVGNHDAELLFPEVQTVLRSLAGPDSQVHFPGFTLDIGGVHIEHGSQLDPMFRMEEQELFVTFNGEEVLNISWGEVALLDTVMTLQSLLAFHDRLQPKTAVFELLPDIKQLLLNTFKKYWMRDYWKGYFGSKDPTKKLSWAMVKDVLWRFFSTNPDTEMDGVLQRRLRESDEFQLYVVGHQHQPSCWSWGDRKLLQSGCLRNEYMIADEGRTLRPMVKTYVEAWLNEGRPVSSGLVELQPPPAPEGYIPDSIFDVLPEVRRLLGLPPPPEPRGELAPPPEEEPRQLTAPEEPNEAAARFLRES